MIGLLLQLAQDAAPNASAAPASPWIRLDTLFWLTLILLLVLAIVGAIVRHRQKDKCLKLLRGYHVTYLSTDGRTIWGDLIVTGQGVELIFDASYENRRGLPKGSALFLGDEIAASLALCRTVHGLTDEERRDRTRQIRRSFRPGALRRTWRWLRNLANTIRDALARAISMAASQIDRTRTLGAAIGSQQGQVDAFGQTLVGMVGNAYEPILERHIGGPVVLELQCPAGAESPRIELPGYLVDYSERFLAVFNVEHEPVETIAIEVAGEPVEREGLRIEPHDQKLTVSCTGQDAIIIRRVEAAGEVRDLAIMLVCGTNVRIARPGAGPATLHVERTRRIDIVCPRALARIRFGGAAQHPRAHWRGVAPDEGDLTARPQHDA